MCRVSVVFPHFYRACVYNSHHLKRFICLTHIQVYQTETFSEQFFHQKATEEQHVKRDLCTTIGLLLLTFVFMWCLFIDDILLAFTFCPIFFCSWNAETFSQVVLLTVILLRSFKWKAAHNKYKGIEYLHLFWPHKTGAPFFSCECNLKSMNYLLFWINSYFWPVSKIKII